MDFSTDDTFVDTPFTPQQEREKAAGSCDRAAKAAKKPVWKTANLEGRVSGGLLDILHTAEAPAGQQQQGSQLKTFAMAGAIIVFVPGEHPYFRLSKIGHHRNTNLFPPELAKFAAEFRNLQSTVARLKAFQGPLPDGLASSKILKEKEEFVYCAEVSVYKGFPHASLTTYYKADDGKLNPCSGAVPVRAEDEAGAVMAFVHECLKPPAPPPRQPPACPLTPTSPTPSQLEAAEAERREAEENNRLG
jgi:hypothetical protein